MANYFNHREALDDFEGLVTSESFDMMDNSAVLLDFTEDDLDGFDSETIEALAERINNDMEGMSSGEAEAYVEDTFGEVFPLLIPLITALAPVVAPMVVQGVSSLISNIANRPAAPAPPSRQAPRPRPVAPPRPAASPRRVPPSTAPVQSPAPPPNIPTADPAASSATTLISLLQNPAVMQAIMGIVQSIGSANNQQTGSVNPQITDLLLGTLSQLAGNVRTEMFGESVNDYPDFLFDANGNLIADPYAPEQMADLLTQQLAAY